MSIKKTITSSMKYLTLGVTALSASYAHAQDTQGVVFNFENVNITDLTRYVAEVTGYNFTVDPNSNAKVSIISPTPVPEEAVLEVYESLLAGVGYALVEDGSGFKVVASSDAPRGQIQTLKGRTAPDDARPAEVVTRILKLRYLNVDSITPIIKPLLSKNANVSAFSPTNSLIVTENFANINRIESIIQGLDTPSSAGAIELIPLKNADAAQVADIIDRIYEVKRRDGNPVQIIPEVTSNKLIVVADFSDLQAIRRLVDKLDLDTNDKVKSVEIFYLKHADAKNLSQVLNEVITRSEEAEDEEANSTDKVKKSSLAALTTFRAPVSVVADESTNALVLSADPVDMVTLQEVIRRLDIQRLQVYVEALIMEVSADIADQFGVEWRATSDIGSGSGIAPFGGVISSANSQINSLASNPLSLPSGFSFGLTGGAINFNGQEYANIGMLINALKSETSVNILSTPQLLTLDNEEAEIIVGDNVPFITGSFSNSNGSSDPFQTIERKDIGLTLRMTPQISENGFIQLKIYQEISSVAPANDAAADLITRKRSIKTSVVVPNNNLVVLGGLIRDDVTESNSAVPCLSNIWGFGQLFKSTSVQNSKTNLMVFLKPRIINTFNDLDTITSTKYTKIREYQKLQPRKGSAVVKRIPIKESDIIPHHLRDDMRGLGMQKSAPAPVATPQTDYKLPEVEVPAEATQVKKPQAQQVYKPAPRVAPKTEAIQPSAPEFEPSLPAEIKVNSVTPAVQKEPVTLFKPSAQQPTKQLEAGEAPMLMPETALLEQNSVVSSANVDVDVLRLRTSAEYAPSLPEAITTAQANTNLGRATNSSTSQLEFSAPAPEVSEVKQAIKIAQAPEIQRQTETADSELIYKEPKVSSQEAIKLKEPEIKLNKPITFNKLDIPEPAIKLVKPIEPIKVEQKQTPAQTQNTETQKVEAVKAQSVQQLTIFEQPSLAKLPKTLPHPLAFVSFDDSLKINDDYLKHLNKLPNIFVDWSKVALEVRAFASSESGLAGRKKALERAKAIRNYLVSSGIAPSKIETYALISNNEPAIKNNAVHVLRVR